MVALYLRAAVVSEELRRRLGDPGAAIGLISRSKVKRFETSRAKKKTLCRVALAARGGSRQRSKKRSHPCGPLWTLIFWSLFNF